MKKLVLGAFLLSSLLSNKSNAQTWSFTSFMGGMNPTAQDIEIVSPTQFYFSGQIGVTQDPISYIHSVNNFAASNVNNGTTNIYASPSIGAYGTSGMRSISFPSTTNGWGIWRNSLTNTVNVINTTNSGATWNTQTSIAGSATKIQFVNETNGWILFWDGIYRTTNGGTTWTPTTNPVTSGYSSMFFTDQNNGYVVLNNNTVYKTTDGGVTWSSQALPGATGTNEHTIHFYDANTGWIVGTGGIIFRTTNAGSTWVAQTSGTTQALRDAYFINSNKGFACGDAGVMCSTIDGGTTWTTQTIPSSGNFIAIDFYQNYGRAITSSARMFKYCDAAVQQNVNMTLCDGGQYGGQYIQGSGTYTFSSYDALGGCEDTVVTANVTAVTPSIDNLATACIINGAPITPVLIPTSNLVEGYTINGLPAGLTSAMVNDTIVISGTVTNFTSALVNIYGVGSCGSIYEGFSLTAGTYSTISQASDYSVCVNEGLIEYLYPTNATSVLISGLPTGVTGTWGGNIVTISGTPTTAGVYTFTATPVNNCGNGASTTGTITVNDANNNTSVSLAGSTLTATQATGTYQWIDCNNNNDIISGATSQTFTPTATGNYAVVLGSGSCSDTSVCTTVTISGGGNVGINENSLSNFGIFPNPSNGEVTISSTQIGGTIQIADATGRMVSSKIISTENTSIDLSENNSGVYFVSIIGTDGSSTTKKLIVRK